MPAFLIRCSGPPILVKKCEIRQKRLPDIRTDHECRRLNDTLEKPVYRGCFTLIYAYGLRISEAVTLPVTAVDSKRDGGQELDMVVNIKSAQW